MLHLVNQKYKSKTSRPLRNQVTPEASVKMDLGYNKIMVLVNRAIKR